MGNFRRIYPSSSAQLQAKYEWLLQGSVRLFASSMKAKAHNTIGRIQVHLLLPASCCHWLERTAEEILRLMQNMTHAPTGFQDSVGSGY